MINLEPLLIQPLWAAIERSYQSGQFTAAILDATHYLGELIREKSGLDCDGVQLVGQAFGGQNPPIKINNLQTESDWNAQKGMEQMLRGLYQGIRNPRSHSKHADDGNDAEAILLFINYLAKIIVQSRSPFELSAYLARVFDPWFTEDDAYAKLMVEDIPIGKRWDVLMAVYGRKEEEGEGQKLAYFVRALLNTFDVEELRRFTEIVSDDLKTTDSIDAMRWVLQVIPDKCWPMYAEVARIRVETRLIEAINKGRCTDGKCVSGGFGTWAQGYVDRFVLRERLMWVLAAKIGRDESEREYVFRYFLSLLPKIAEKPPVGMAESLRKGLEAGDVRFYRALSGIVFFGASGHA